MSTKDEGFVVVPLDELPSEVKNGAPDAVEAEEQKIRDRMLQKIMQKLFPRTRADPKTTKPWPSCGLWVLTLTSTLLVPIGAMRTES